jgi:hypothetical protein
MSRMRSLNRLVWIAIWCLAIVVTLVGGSWSTPTSVPASWKVDIQSQEFSTFFYLGWFIGPLQVMMSPPVVCILTILINVVFYYLNPS